MVFLRLGGGPGSGGMPSAAKAGELAAFLKDRGILILGRHPIRIVTHLDVDRRDAAALAEGIRVFLGITS